MAQAKRKKRFFKVDMPILGKETELQAFELSELGGRIIKYDLTRLLRGKGTLMSLKVSVKKEKATSEPIMLDVLPFVLKRMVRKGTDYIEDSFSTNCKDKKIRIKPILVSRRKISRAVKKALRNKAKETIQKELETKTSEEIFEELLRGQIQKKISGILKKVYPLSTFEIRNIKVEGPLDKKKETEKKEKEEKKEETKE
ncbi:MAG: hypothetical protein ABH840_03060 [Nanoarchaeota archaeon]